MSALHSRRGTPREFYRVVWKRGGGERRAEGIGEKKRVKVRKRVIKLAPIQVKMDSDD